MASPDSGSPPTLVCTGAGQEEPGEGRQAPSFSLRSQLQETPGAWQGMDRDAPPLREHFRNISI